MTRVSLAAVAFFVVYLPALALAEQKTHPEAKVSVDVPAGWKCDVDQHTMTITDPNEEVAVALMIVEAHDIEKAADALDQEVGKSVKDLKWDGEPSEIKLNGMDAIALDGKGKIEGEPVDLGVLLVATPSGKILLVLGAVETAKSKKHDATIEKLLKSIKPAK